MKTYQILLVDDIASNLQTLVLQLEESGKAYNLLIALSGKMALQIAEQNPPDLVITDWEMPEMSGLELIKALKTRPETQFVPVLMVSGMRTQPEDLQKAMNVGAIDFLRKPINKVELWARVENLLKLSEAEKQQRQINTQLAALDQLKTRFFTNISHEFRTPLTVIQGMANQILGQPDKWALKGGDMILRNTNNLLNLVNQILELRKLESGQLSLNLVQSNIVAFLKYLTESFQSLAENKEINLSFISEQEKIWMDYDPEKILRIISNLLFNAVKFTSSGGAVNIVVSQFPEGVRIIISDTGIGIPAEELPHIFGRFYQVDTSTTREGEGTGIGLSLSKELVHMMGGEIEVESQINVGTTFRIQFPILQNAPREEQFKKIDPEDLPQSYVAGAATASPGSVGELPTLLIIEDNHDIVEYLASCLDDQYILLIARDGQQGIDMALEQVPDLIISDVMMPRKDGFEVCEFLKNDERTSHIPIIILTAKADHESRIQGLKKGADAYLAKPFNKEELLVRLEMLLALRRKLQARYASDALSEDEAVYEQEDDFIRKIRTIMEENLIDTSFSITELCEMVGMSRSNLHRKITALTGRSSSIFIRLIRLQKAREILVSTDYNVSEIAYQVGFSDPKYFTRAFTKEFGHSPKEVRKS